MNNGSLQYIMPIFNGLLGRTPLVKDGDGWADLNLEARVRSGDYFVTLASQLDSLAQAGETYETRLELEDIVSELIYLQDNYLISKKEK